MNTYDVMIQNMTDDVQRLMAENSRLTAENQRLSEIVCETHKMDVDSPLFHGLVFGSMSQGMLLNTIRSVKAERDEARDAARFLLVSRDREKEAIARWPWLEDKT